MREWPKAGDRMRFLSRNGYENELKAAQAKIKEGEILTVSKFHLGGWHSSIEFEELTGRFNSVMFEPVNHP